VRTLRSRLTGAVIATLIVVGVIAATVSYRNARAEAHEELDDQLRQVANLAVSVFYTSQPNYRSTVGMSDPEDEIIVAVYDPRGLVYSTRQGPLPAAGGHLGIGMEPVGGQPYSVYRLIQGPRTVVVAQQIDVRDEIAIAAAESAALPVLAAIPILALVLMLAIGRALRPLTIAAQKIARRPPDSLAPLGVDDLPAEIEPLVGEIDRLIERLATTLETERRFFADAAHALRTPVAALQLQADVLSGANNPVDQRERASELQAGVRRIGRLVTQLLAWARQDAPTRQAATCDINAILRDVVELYEHSAAKTQVRVDFSSNKILRCHGAATDLSVAFANLLDNAIRVSPVGGVVGIDVSADEADIHVGFRDDGPGLPDLELERVFERFYQGSTAAGGAGLGLATARRIVEGYKGNVRLENRPGGGLVARITLPRCRIARRSSVSVTPRCSSGREQR